MSANRLLPYVERYFLTRADFLQAANCADLMLTALIEAKAIPGPIYRIWGDGSIWSALDELSAVQRATSAQSEWFSAAAVWWGRRAKVLAEGDPARAAQVTAAFLSAFQHDFTDALGLVSSARFGYAEQFAGQNVDPVAAAAMAAKEWADWIDGGYGVCMRRFDAVSMITKESRSKQIQFITLSGAKEQLDAGERLELLEALERLDAVMLPFAPHQRPNGTPGRWIDAIMAKYGLGRIPLIGENRSAKAAADILLCA